MEAPPVSVPAQRQQGSLVVTAMGEQSRGEQVPIHQFTAHFHTWEGLGQASVDLALMLILPKALMPIQGWLVSAAGQERRLMEGTGDLCHSMTPLWKAFSFSLSLSPAKLIQSAPCLPTRQELEEGPGQACHQLLVRSQVCVSTHPAPVPSSLMDRGLSPPGDVHCQDLQLQHRQREGTKKLFIKPQTTDFLLFHFSSGANPLPSSVYAK